MAGNSAESLFKQVWVDVHDQEYGVTPGSSPDEPDAALSEEEKAQLHAMQKLADFFTASPGFMGKIEKNEAGGLSLIVSRNDVSINVPFACFAIHPDVGNPSTLFTEEPEIRPTGYTVFSIAGAESNLDEIGDDWYDMTQTAFVEKAKANILWTLADKVKTTLHTNAALRFIETIKPRI